MIEGRGGASLAAEALERLRIARHFVGKEFEGDEAAEVGVFRLVDYSHAAAAEFVDDAVVRDGLADHSVLPIIGVWSIREDVRGSSRLILRTGHRPVNE